MLLSFDDYYNLFKNDIPAAEMDAAYKEYRDDYLYYEYRIKLDTKDEERECPARRGIFSVCVYNVVTNISLLFVTTLYRILYILNLLKL